MKLLFDQNLSFRLCGELSGLFPDSRHVGQMGLAAAEDRQVWDAAKEGGFTLVSQDADFAEMTMHRGQGPLPKVIWLRCGNQPTQHIADLLRARIEVIRAFENDTNAVCPEIY